MNPRGRPRRPTDSPPYKGEYTRIWRRPTSDDFDIWEYYPEHPAANRDGLILQSRLVLEDKIGRYLRGDEVAHHDDENTVNNDPKNLFALTRSAHKKLHLQRDPPQIPLTEDQVREALHGRTTLQAAEFLGVSHNTLRLRFDHLLVKRRSPRKVYPPELIEEIRKGAADNSLSMHDLAAKLGETAPLIDKICEQEGIVWVKKLRSDRGKKRRAYRKKSNFL